MKRQVKHIVVYALLIGVSILFVLPFLWLVSTSLKTPNKLWEPGWIPDPIAWDNYKRAFEFAPLLLYTRNSVVVAVLAAFAVTFSSAIVAYGFSCFRFKGRDIIFLGVLATMMVPGTVTMIPQFLIFRNLGMLNTLYPLWVGNLFGSAFYIFMLRQFFLSLPGELIEAARVDGAGFIRMFWSVLMPQIKPALITVFIFEFKASWNDFMRPLIYISRNDLITLPLGLQRYVAEFGSGGLARWELLMAASVLFTLPMIIIFFLAQRHFVEGIATTGTKG